MNCYMLDMLLAQLSTATCPVPFKLAILAGLRSVFTSPSLAPCIFALEGSISKHTPFCFMYDPHSHLTGRCLLRPALFIQTWRSSESGIRLFLCKATIILAVIDSQPNNALCCATFIPSSSFFIN